MGQPVSCLWEGCIAAKGPGSGLQDVALKSSPTKADSSCSVLSDCCQRSKQCLKPQSSL